MFTYEYFLIFFPNIFGVRKATVCTFLTRLEQLARLRGFAQMRQIEKLRAIVLLPKIAHLRQCFCGGSPQNPWGAGY